MRLTFSTHFYESHSLRSLFALATVASWAEAPAQQDYAVFDLVEGRYPRLGRASAYADWLADCLRSARWEEVGALNAALDWLRDRHDGRGVESVPVSARACAALWERAGDRLTHILVGNASLIVEFLRQMSSPAPLADALLAAASPSELCGTPVASDTTQVCLSTLQSAASPKIWRGWMKRWREDPVLVSFAQTLRPWWQFWR